MSTYVSSRMEKNFTNPLEFKPEKFFQDSDIIDTQYEYIFIKIKIKNNIILF